MLFTFLRRIILICLLIDNIKINSLNDDNCNHLTIGGIQECLLKTSAHINYVENKKARQKFGFEITHLAKLHSGNILVVQSNGHIQILDPFKNFKIIKSFESSHILWQGEITSIVELTQKDNISMLLVFVKNGITLAIEVMNDFNYKFYTDNEDYTTSAIELDNNIVALAKFSGIIQLISTNLTYNSDYALIGLEKGRSILTKLRKAGVLVSGSFDGKVIIWDAYVKKQMTKTIKMHNQPVTAFLQLENGILVTAFEDGVILLFDPDSDFHLIKTIYAHNAKITSLILIDNGTFASCSLDGEIKFWNSIDDYELMQTLTSPNYSITLKNSGITSFTSLIQIKKGVVVSGSTEGIFMVWIDIENLGIKNKKDKAIILFSLAIIILLILIILWNLIGKGKYDTYKYKKE